MGDDGGRLRRALRRLAAPDSEVEADELKAQATREGATAMAECRQGSQVCVAGTVRAVRLAPFGGTPSLEADLYDGSATIRLVFLGRRAIAGLEPGRSLVAHGRLTRRDGRAIIFNPSYELVPANA